MISKYLMLLSPYTHTHTHIEYVCSTLTSQSGAPHLSAQVNHVCVGVVVRQQHSVAGVELQQSDGLLEVCLQRGEKVTACRRTDGAGGGRAATGSQSPSSLWLILVKPVVKMFPSRVKMALIGRMPSCGARRSCAEQPQAGLMGCSRGQKPSAVHVKLTATTSLLRGSHTRRRRSLQVVQNRLPFRFQLML